MNEAIKKKPFETIQVRVNECKNFGVYLIRNGEVTKEQDFESDKPVTTLYVNPERARKLAFSLLSAAKRWSGVSNGQGIY